MRPPRREPRSATQPAAWLWTGCPVSCHGGGDEGDASLLRTVPGIRGRSRWSPRAARRRRGFAHRALPVQNGHDEGGVHRAAEGELGAAVLRDPGGRGDVLPETKLTASF